MAKPKSNPRYLLIAIGILIVISAIYFLLKKEDINSFEECRKAGGAIAESYPEQCFINGKGFTGPKN